MRQRTDGCLRAEESDASNSQRHGDVASISLGKGDRMFCSHRCAELPA